jgi:hypothetical protein
MSHTLCLLRQLKFFPRSKYYLDYLLSVACFVTSLLQYVVLEFMFVSFFEALYSLWKPHA